jgi:hypothetical protein
MSRHFVHGEHHMTPWQEERELIRRFLLGDLDEERREQVEERLLTDAELHVSLSAARDELIDEYVFGVMGGRELKLFEENFHFTPERLHELRLSRALKRYVGEDAMGEAAAVAEVRSGRFSLFSRRVWIGAAAAALAAVIVGYGGWTIYHDRQLRTRLAELQSQRARVEHDLTLLNQRPAPDLGDGRPGVVRLTLSPEIDRGSGEERRALVGEEKEFLLLRLQLSEDKLQSYRAVIETEDGAYIYTVESLTKSVTGQGKSVLLLLPSRLLPTGNYQIRLIGDAESRNVEIGIYPFQVVLR